MVWAAWHYPACGRPCRAYRPRAQDGARHLRPGRALRQAAAGDRLQALHDPRAGHALPGVIGFRDIDDVATMVQAAKNHRHAVVIGGGLLGLEAANGLLRQGMDVTRSEE